MPKCNELPAEQWIAAVDLGSNSFHMVIAQIIDGKLQLTEKMREGVQLAAGLDDNNELSEKSCQRAYACLQRFGQRLSTIPTIQVRAVGTNTLRIAHNAQKFIKKAQTLLGYHIDVIAGKEEARLIYLGATHSLKAAADKQLIIDIGGGSTELIVGIGHEPKYLDSLYMGCISFGQSYFSQGQISPQAMSQAESAAMAQLEPIVKVYKDYGWSSCCGCSGTVQALFDVIQANGWSSQVLTFECMQKIRAKLLQVTNIADLKLAGLKTERMSIFPSGFAILSAIFTSFELDNMYLSTGALREGIIHDLIGRNSHSDQRERTINNMISNYRIDKTYAQQVATTALACLEQVKTDWALTAAKYTHYLQWAASLHEIGKLISYRHCHKHGSYIIQHADMLGFSQHEQRIVALLVRGYRRKFPKTAFGKLPKAIYTQILYLCILLRLAVIMHNNRGQQRAPKFFLTATNNALDIHFTDDALATRPLLAYDLEEEATLLQALGFRLTKS